MSFHRTDFPLIRANNPSVYLSNTSRSGEWAKITGVAVVSPTDTRGAIISQQVCFVVEFINGDIDQWPVEDLAAEYEFFPTMLKK